MSEQIAVELRVLGHNFRLATTETEKGDLERAAELLNEKYEQTNQYNKQFNINAKAIPAKPIISINNIVKGITLNANIASVTAKSLVIALLNIM